MIATAPAPTAVEPREHYLNAGYGVKSWLLTVDHKRIALLYLASITLFFVLGGAFAVLVRLELVTPEGDLMRSETYNKMFTMHGLIMVFFFLIPSIPAVLGNFLLPIMIGARDLAFPRLNLASWYVYTLGGLFTLGAATTGGVDTGWTFYTPYSSTYSNSAVIATAIGVFIVGFSSILTGLNFIVTIHKIGRPGVDLVPVAVVCMGALRHEPGHHAGDARVDRRDSAGGHRAHVRHWNLRSGPGAATPSCFSTCFGSTLIRPFTS